MHVEVLEWDSEFFDVSIGRLVTDGPADAGAITSALADAREAGVRCVYARIDPTDTDLVIAANGAGLANVEVAMDLLHPDSLIQHLPPTSSVARLATVDDLPALAGEIALMAPWSRYAMDPRFGLEAARRMHEAWVARAARDADRAVVVAEDEQGISGFSTIATLPGEDPRIDLIASSRPGSGAAYALVDFIFHRFGRVRSWGGPIAARNVASLRFCEHMGYRVGTVAYIYHCWLDQGPGAR